ncbi:MAG: hypothetical protein LC655_01305, partial [Bacteroidales bacterium]|nr:hypothetical protein [Bacteroidales bacterium]
MTPKVEHITETVHIKNMVCNCCKFLLKEKFEASGITVHEITLGKAKISYDKSVISYKKINSILNRY